VAEARVPEAAPQQVRFHRSLYAPEAVEEAVRAFADLATLEILRNAEDTLVVIQHAHPSVSGVLADELANFALAETVARSREVQS
jgi:hypothetical protein